jgi:hypothetical protein
VRLHVVSRGEYWFVFIAIAEAAVCADFALRYRAANDSVRFDSDALVLSRRGRETRVPYASIESLAEERHAVVRVNVAEGKCRSSTPFSPRPGVDDDHAHGKPHPRGHPRKDGQGGIGLLPHR